MAFEDEWLAIARGSVVYIEPTWKFIGTGSRCPGLFSLLLVQLLPILPLLLLLLLWRTEKVCDLFKHAIGISQERRMETHKDL